MVKALVRGLLLFQLAGCAGLQVVLHQTAHLGKMDHTPEAIQGEVAAGVATRPVSQPNGFGLQLGGEA